MPRARAGRRGPGPYTAAFVAADEDGLILSAGAVPLEAGGAYAFTVLLQVSRDGGDASGRLYSIAVHAQDDGGDTCTAAATVLVHT